jgi:hypothetical protein
MQFRTLASAPPDLQTGPGCNRGAVDLFTQPGCQIPPEQGFGGGNGTRDHGRHLMAMGLLEHSGIGVSAPVGQDRIGYRARADERRARMAQFMRCPVLTETSGLGRTPEGKPVVAVPVGRPMDVGNTKAALCPPGEAPAVPSPSERSEAL